MSVEWSTPHKKPTTIQSQFHLLKLNICAIFDITVSIGIISKNCPSSKNASSSGRTRNSKVQYYHGYISWPSAKKFNIHVQYLTSKSASVSTDLKRDLTLFCMAIFRYKGKCIIFCVIWRTPTEMIKQREKRFLLGKYVSG